MALGPFMDKLLALKMFVETVRCGGYSSAARKLGIATSSVTRQVAGLESELGASLLNRTTRNTSVTVGHRIESTDGATLYSDGNVVLVWIDPKSGRPIPLPDGVREMASR